MEDLKSRFGVGRIALVADRGLISEDNLALVLEARSFCALRSASTSASFDGRCRNSSDSGGSGCGHGLG